MASNAWMVRSEKGKSISRMGLASIAVLGSLLVGTNAASAADLVVSSYGGVFEEALRSCWVEPFEKQTGKTVDVSIGMPNLWLTQASATQGKPAIDVVFTQADSFESGLDQGLFDEIDTTKVPHATELIPDAVKLARGHAVITHFAGAGLVYNKTTVTNPPATWQEFIDGVIAGKWRGAMNGPAMADGPGLLWFVSKLYGGGADNIDPGLAKLKEARDSGNLVYASDPNQVFGLLQSGDVDVAQTYDGRGWAFIRGGNGADFNYIVPTPGSPVVPIFMSKVKDSSPLAWDFINIALSPEAQACFGSKVLYSMSNVNVQYPDDIKDLFTKRDELVFPPFDQFVKQIPQWVERWNKDIAQ